MYKNGVFSGPYFPVLNPNIGKYGLEKTPHLGNVHPVMTTLNSLFNKASALHKKWSFPLTISSVNVAKSAEICGFGQIYWKNPKWKTSFFVRYWLYLLCPRCFRGNSWALLKASSVADAIVYQKVQRNIYFLTYLKNFLFFWMQEITAHEWKTISFRNFYNIKSSHTEI